MRAPVASRRIFSWAQFFSRCPLRQQLLQRTGSLHSQTRCLFEWQRKQRPKSHNGGEGLAGAAALKTRRKAGEGGGRRDLDVTRVQGLVASSRGAAAPLPAPAGTHECS
jgi:hypothetical protein